VVNRTNFLDTLCLGFEGGSFYGLEYVLDDLFEETKELLPVSALPGFDWFGLDS
jgi:hypothetical protein